MKKSVWKFELEIRDTQEVMLPDDAEILTAQLQGEAICLWALMDTQAKRVARVVEIFGTGHSIPSDLGASRRYIATVQTWNSRQQ